MKYMEGRRGWWCALGLLYMSYASAFVANCATDTTGTYTTCCWCGAHAKWGANVFSCRNHGVGDTYWAYNSCEDQTTSTLCTNAGPRDAPGGYFYSAKHPDNPYRPCVWDNYKSTCLAPDDAGVQAAAWDIPRGAGPVSLSGCNM